jgi:hypothetical protein
MVKRFKLLSVWFIALMPFGRECDASMQLSLEGPDLMPLRQSCASSRRKYDLKWHGPRYQANFVELTFEGSKRLELKDAQEHRGAERAELLPSGLLRARRGRAISLSRSPLVTPNRDISNYA